MARRTFAKDAGERITLQARATTQVRDRLAEAAQQSGRSLSQEMEMRLSDSLTIEDVAEHSIKLAREREVPIIDGLGGPETYDLFQDIAFLIQGVEADYDKRWFESPEIKASLYKVLEAALPELLRASRVGRQPNAFMRAVDYAKYLPERPKKPAPEMPKGARFMTDEEHARFFYLNEDNADAPEERAKRARSIRVPLNKE